MFSLEQASLILLKMVKITHVPRQYTIKWVISFLQGGRTIKACWRFHFATFAYRQDKKPSRVLRSTAEQRENERQHNMAFAHRVSAKRAAQKEERKHSAAVKLKEERKRRSENKRAKK